MNEEKQMIPDFDSPKNWKDDYGESGENMYACGCRACGEYFYGHKRRFVCKVCDEKLTELFCQDKTNYLDEFYEWDACDYIDFKEELLTESQEAYKKGYRDGYKAGMFAVYP